MTSAAVWDSSATGRRAGADCSCDRLDCSRFDSWDPNDRENRDEVISDSLLGRRPVRGQAPVFYCPRAVPSAVG